MAFPHRELSIPKRLRYNSDTQDTKSTAYLHQDSTFVHAISFQMTEKIHLYD